MIGMHEGYIESAYDWSVATYSSYWSYIRTSCLCSDILQVFYWEQPLDCRSWGSRT